MTTQRKRQANSGKKKEATARGQFLRDFRKFYGVTLEELAKRADLSQPMLTRFETGARNLSPEAQARVLVAMDAIKKEKRAERKARFEDLGKRWMKSLVSPFFGESRATIEAEQQRIIEEDQSELELSKLINAQRGELIPHLENHILAEIRKHPEKVVQEYSALIEWRQKLLDLEAQGYVMMPKAVEEERDQLKARVAELEKELKAYQELLPQSTRRIEELEQELKIVEPAARQAYDELLPQAKRRIEELEQELARERANKAGDSPG